MDTLTEQRLREMEAEMSRFEEEISVPKPEDEIVTAPQESNEHKTIIGAGTYHQVKAQLEHWNDRPPGTRLPGLMLPRSASISAAPKLLPPPPPPPLGLRPPPPPPAGLMPTRPPPSFVPPQLRSLSNHPRPFGTQIRMTPPIPPTMPRWPPGDMPMPPRPPPPGYPGDRMPQPPPGYFPPPPNMMPNTGNRPNVISAAPTVIIAKPKIVYSAPPTRVKTAKKVKRKAAAPANTSQVPIVETPSSHPPSVAPGIEMNIPMQEIEAERIGMDPTNIGTTQEEYEALDGDMSRKEKKSKKKKFVRMAAGETWEDPTLGEWDTDDFRMFCGDLGNEVTDETLVRAFSRYPTFVKARVVRDKKTQKTKGYGFASFRDPNDFVKAMREMNGKYVGNRPIKLRKSCWRDRQAEIVKKKEKEKKRLGFR